MMTLERWIFNRISDSIDTISTVKHESGISMRQTDSMSQNRFVKLTSFEVICIESTKTAAAADADAVDAIIDDIASHNYVMMTEINTEASSREDSPARWVYTIAFTVQHRRIADWSEVA